MNANQKKRYLKDSNGRRVAVYLDGADRTIEFAGHRGPQTVASTQDYRYTHGGRLYQEACDMWRRLYL